MKTRLVISSIFVLRYSEGEEEILRYLDRLQPLALLVLRVVLGVIMIGHGYAKLSGGPSKFVHWVASMGLPGWLAYLSLAAEVLGGALVIVGLLTRFASLAIVIDLAVAIWKVHWRTGIFAKGGYEFPLAVASIAFALIFFGAGPIALDNIRRSGGGGPTAKKA